MRRRNRPWKWMLLLLSLLLLIVLGIVIMAGIRNFQKGNSSEKREKRVSDEAASEEAETSHDDTAADVDEAAGTGVQENTESPLDSEDSVVMETDAEPEILEPEEVNIESNGKKIAIDPGHQGKGNSEKEPIGPGASQMKAKVASGTTGRTTGVPEYQLNLDVSLKLRDELEARGYEVYMIRETNDMNISNAERAKAAADAEADLLIRIHANGSENPSVAGALSVHGLAHAGRPAVLQPGKRRQGCCAGAAKPAALRGAASVSPSHERGDGCNPVASGLCGRA